MCKEPLAAQAQRLRGQSKAGGEALAWNLKVNRKGTRRSLAREQGYHRPGRLCQKKSAGTSSITGRGAGRERREEEPFNDWGGGRGCNKFVPF